MSALRERIITALAAVDASHDAGSGDLPSVEEYADAVLSSLALEPEAREEPRMPKVESLEIINGWLVERGAHPGEYPAGAAYGMLPDSDAEPLMDLSQIPGWPEAREVTEAEVEAAARELNAQGYRCDEGNDSPGMFDKCRECRRVCREVARAALEAAREVE